MDDETLNHLIGQNRSLRERFAEFRQECAHLSQQVAENRLQLARFRAAAGRSELAAVTARQPGDSQNKERG